MVMPQRRTSARDSLTFLSLTTEDFRVDLRSSLRVLTMRHGLRPWNNTGVVIAAATLSVLSGMTLESAIGESKRSVGGDVFFIDTRAMNKVIIGSTISLCGLPASS